MRLRVHSWASPKKRINFVRIEECSWYEVLCLVRRRVVHGEVVGNEKD